MIGDSGQHSGFVARGYRRSALQAALFGVASLAFVAACSPASEQATAEPVAPQHVDARAIHDAVLVLDAHADVLLPSTPQRYYAPDGGSRVSLDKLVAGGVDAVVLSVAVGPGPRDAKGVAAARVDADAKLAKIKAFVSGNAAKVGLASSADDVDRLHREGRVAVIIGFQNARSIGKDVSQLDAFYKEGVRVFALNHAGHNDFSDSSRPGEDPVSEHGGLSPLGREAVKRLNDLGALIDVSQLSSDALLQTLQLTRAPIAATHSNVRALIDETRNLSDTELDAIKVNGGVVQLTPFNAYLIKADPAAREAISAVREKHGLAKAFSNPSEGYGTLPAAAQDAFLKELGPVQPKASVTEFVDHIDYVARRIGWEHVGIGTDFDHGSGIKGFDSEAEAPNVTAELVKRGYTQDQLAGIWGGNFLRVLRAAEKAAAPAGTAG